MKKERFLFLVFKIVTTCASFAIAILAKSNINWNDLSANYVDLCRVKEIIYDFSIGIFSSMFLVWFIDGISENLQKKELEREQSIVLKEQNKTLQEHIERYLNLYYYVVTPSQEWKTSNHTIPSRIPFQRMCDLHKPSVELGMRSPIEAFLEVEQTLKSLFSYYLLSGSINPSTSAFLVNFITESNKLESRATILAVENQLADNKSIIDFISEQLVNGTVDEVYKKSKIGQEKNNLLYPYVQLRETMEKERHLLLQYQEAIADSSITSERRYPR